MKMKGSKSRDENPSLGHSRADRQDAFLVRQFAALGDHDGNQS
jgi:hypothetical protein